MKKYTYLLLAGAAALSLASCKNDGPAPENNAEATRTNAVVTVSIEKVSDLKADAGINDKQDKDVQPVDGEGKIQNVALFGKTSGLQVIPETPDAASKYNGTTVTTWTSDVFETTARTESMVIIAYSGTNNFVQNASDFRDDVEVGINLLPQMADMTNGFLFTSALPTTEIEVMPNIKKDDVDATHNTFTLNDLERVVSKAQVHQPTGGILSGTGHAQDVAGSLSNYKWTIEGTAKRAYLFGSNAGERSISLQGTNYVYKGFKSLIDDENGIETFNANLTTFTADPNYENIGDWSASPADATKNVYGVTLSSLPTGLAANFEAIALTENKDWTLTGTDPLDMDAGKSLNTGVKFFLENGHTGDSELAANLRYKEVAHVNVYADMTINPSGTMVDKVITAAYVPGDEAKITALTATSTTSDLVATGIFYEYSYDDDGDATTPDVNVLRYKVEDDRLEVIRDAAEADAYQTATTTDFAARSYWVEVPFDFASGLSDDIYDASRVRFVTFEKFSPKTDAKIEVVAKADKATDKSTGNAGVYLFKINDAANTFYVATINTTEKIFNTLYAARVKTGGTKTVKKYEAGRNVYMTPLNAQADDDGMIYNTDTRRNNIYDLTIAEINGIGFNYNPVFPLDPEAPIPGDNPDEPDPDPDTPPVNDNPTNMKVLAKVWNWNYVERSVKFNGGTGY